MRSGTEAGDVDSSASSLFLLCALCVEAVDAEQGATARRPG
jgi:hypothetical protein